jgi:hypothetical protein
MLCGGVDAPITPGTIAAFCLMRAVPTHWNESPHRFAPLRAPTATASCSARARGCSCSKKKRSRDGARGEDMGARRGLRRDCEAFHRVALSDPGEAARAMKMRCKTPNLAPEQSAT